MDFQRPAGFPDCHRCRLFRTARPPACLACAAPHLAQVGAQACPVCSQRLNRDQRCPNELCHSPRRRIGRIHAIAYQSGPLRRAINSFKYRGTASWSLVFGRLVLAWLDQNLASDPPDLIVANPGFASPGGREFAHAEAVLAAAARSDSARRWPFDTATPAAIVKIQPTLASADAQAWAKRAVARELQMNLLVPEPSRISGRYILVYDDVCTTGGQLDAVAGCLLDRGGAARVEAVVLARAPWRGH